LGFTEFDGLAAKRFCFLKLLFQKRKTNHAVIFAET